jgi:hypothetical protein
MRWTELVGSVVSLWIALNILFVLAMARSAGRR